MTAIKKARTEFNKLSSTNYGYQDLVKLHNLHEEAYKELEEENNELKEFNQDLSERNSNYIKNQTDKSTNVLYYKLITDKVVKVIKDVIKLNKQTNASLIMDNMKTPNIMPILQKIQDDILEKIRGDV